MRLAWLLVLVLSACSSDDDETCARVALPDTSVFNPFTATCLSGGGDCTDDDSGDGPVPTEDTWPLCNNMCSDVVEEECLVRDGCRAGYTVDGSAPTFRACWAVNTDGPIHGVGCDTDGANECARRDDCSPLHDPSGIFQSCVVEPKSTLGECTFARCTPAE